MCQAGLEDDHANTPEHLEARKAAVEREIVPVKTDLVRHDVNT